MAALSGVASLVGVDALVTVFTKKGTAVQSQIIQSCLFKAGFFCSGPQIRNEALLRRTLVQLMLLAAHGRTAGL